MYKNMNAQRFRRGVIAAVALSLSAITAPQAISSETKYTYDALGRVTEACYPDNTRVTYQYDAAGNRTQVSKTAMSCANGGANIAPACTNFTINLGIPAYATPQSVSVAEELMLSRCSDANGHALTVTTPTIPHSITIAAGQTINVPFTVSDGNGGTAGATITYIRSN